MEYGEYLAHMNMRRRKPKKDDEADKPKKNQRSSPSSGSPADRAAANDTRKNTQSHRPSRMRLVDQVINKANKQIRTGIKSAEDSAAARDKIAYERKKYIRAKTDSAVQQAVDTVKNRRQQKEAERKKKRARAVNSLKNLLKGAKRS